MTLQYIGWQVTRGPNESIDYADHEWSTGNKLPIHEHGPRGRSLIICRVRSSAVSPLVLTDYRLGCLSGHRLPLDEGYPSLLTRTLIERLGICDSKFA